MKSIKYCTEDMPLVDEKIITIGSQDKYLLTRDTCVMKIFRYDDGRTINEKHTYKIILQDCTNGNKVYIRTGDIILNIWHMAPDTLIILRPVFRRE